MPDRHLLHVGDKIRLLAVPVADVVQRERERRDGPESPGWSADIIERILAQDPIVTIARLDEYGYPWFDCEVAEGDGVTRMHTLAIMDDDSWERLKRPE